MGSFVAGLDATVVNVALPAIRDDLGGGLAGQQWVSNAYLLTLGSLILVGGSLGDVFGERRVFSHRRRRLRRSSSLLCALAPTIEVLVAGRALQGVFGALLTPSALAVIIVDVPAERARRGDRLVDGVGGHRDGRSGRWRAAGSSTRRRGAGSSPSTCRSCSITLALVAVAVPGARAAARRRAPVDWLGAVLTARSASPGPVLALIRQPSVGLGPPAGVVPGAGRHRAARRCSSCTSARTPHPMLPLGLFRAAQLRGRQRRRRSRCTAGWA